MIIKAVQEDLDEIEKIYDELHDAEENGRACIGWIRGVYPTRKTAEEALQRGDMFVEKVDDKVVGSGIINQIQVDSYAGGKWTYDADPRDVMVLHTLTISPKTAGKGYGKQFVDFYESFAADQGCHYLRMDTNEKNKNARNMYRHLGYEEVDCVPTVFNGIPNVNLILLEKKLN